jgi:hypothetical protein
MTKFINKPSVPNKNKTAVQNKKHQETLAKKIGSPYNKK